MPSNERQESWERLSEDGFRNQLKGQLLEAELFYSAALATIKRSRNNMAAGAAKLYFRLGDLNSERQDYARAETYYRHCLAEYEGLDGDHVIDICIVLKRISEICRLQNKNRQASNLAGRSQRLLKLKRAMLEKSFDKDHREESA